MSDMVVVVFPFVKSGLAVSRHLETGHLQMDTTIVYPSIG